MDKQNVAGPHSGGLCGCETEWSADVYDTVDEPWKYIAEWKKLDAQDPVLFDFTYMKGLK